MNPSVGVGPQTVVPRFWFVARPAARSPLLLRHSGDPERKRRWAFPATSDGRSFVNAAVCAWPARPVGRLSWGCGVAFALGRVAAWLWPVLVIARAAPERAGTSRR